MGVNSKENISRVEAIDLSATDYEPGGGFFFRANTGGTIRYCPVGNKTDAEYVEKTIEAHAEFVDPEYCRKIFKTGTTAQGLYAGFGF